MRKLEHSESLVPSVDPTLLCDASLAKRVELLGIIATDVEAEIGFCVSEQEARLEGYEQSTQIPQA